VDRRGIGVCRFSSEGPPAASMSCSSRVASQLSVDTQPVSNAASTSHSAGAAVHFRQAEMSVDLLVMARILADPTGGLSSPLLRRPAYRTSVSC
jgi:hypothetical protein